MQWLKHAFAISPAAAFTPTQAEHELVARLCVELVRRNLTLPASILLESFRPLSGIATQAVIFSTPWFATVTDTAGLQTIARLLERPGAVDWLLEQLQNVDDASTVTAVRMSGDAPPPHSPTTLTH
ncbi:hypothetical protein GC163_01860 [bacterium]|nr:hypothetical protein [bacterium]